MPRSISSTRTEVFRGVALAFVLTVSVAVGTVGFAGSAAAGVSNSQVDDVGTGLDTVTQNVTVTQADTAGGNGDTDGFKINVSSVIDQGASVTDVSFVDSGSEDVALAKGPSFHASNGTITLAVTESDKDSDVKLDFSVNVQLNTTAATPATRLDYDIEQYDSPDWTDDPRSRSLDRFALYGTDDLTVSTSNNTANYGPVTHSAAFQMTATMDVHQLVVRTEGADYGNVSQSDIARLTVGSTELADSITSVSASSGGSVLTITLEGTPPLEHGDQVHLAIEDARNPPSSTELRVVFANEDGARFAAADRLNVTSTDSSSSAPTNGGSSNTDTNNNTNNSTDTNNNTNIDTNDGSNNSTDTNNNTNIDTNDDTNSNVDNNDSSNVDNNDSSNVDNNDSSNVDDEEDGSDWSDDAGSDSSSSTEEDNGDDANDEWTTESSSSVDDSSDVNLQEVTTTTTTDGTANETDGETTTEVDSPGFTAGLALTALAAFVVLSLRRL